MRGFLRWVVVAAATSASAIGFSAPASASIKPLIITVSPSPMISTSASTNGGIFDAVVQVSGVAKYAGHTVNIFSTGLSNRCSGGVTYETLLGGSPNSPRFGANGFITVVLDAKGNATVVMTGMSCKLGNYLVKATFDAPPFSSATTRMLLSAPSAVPGGITGSPANEVETGDGGSGQGIYGALDVYTVFTVGAGMAAANQPVDITSSSLLKSCALGYRWENATGAKLRSSNTGGGTVTATTVADSVGNAFFIFKGASCAAGTSTVTATVLKATLSTNYTVQSPVTKL